MKRRIDHYASFKDPAARVFRIEGEDGYIFRELHADYLPHYERFKSSGLAAELIRKKWLVPFEELSDQEPGTFLKAKKITFVSYPYEWSFNQWKDAALLTLKIQYQALKHGMVLKDATPFNIVFDGPRPVFVDISSFEILDPRLPWQAFKQFSENFYLPILLIKYFDATGNDIYLNNMNGIPVSKGLALLPAKAYFNFNTVFFLAIPGKIRNQLKPVKGSQTHSARFSRERSMQLADQLFHNISKLKQPARSTKWNHYYGKDVDAVYLKEKTAAVKTWIGKNYAGKTLIDFGCNTGNFSRLLADAVKHVIAFDEDIRSVDELYIHCREQQRSNISCFAANLSRPSPALGWNNSERSALTERLRGDIGLALALVHHLAISDHIQFDMMADLFAGLCTELIIEFVPKEDAKVQLLLSGRDQVFEWYNWNGFLDAFQKRFTLVQECRFSNDRILVHFILKNEQ